MNRGTPPPRFGEKNPQVICLGLRTTNQRNQISKIKIKFTSHKPGVEKVQLLQKLLWSDLAF